MGCKASIYAGLQHKKAGEDGGGDGKFPTAPTTLAAFSMRLQMEQDYVKIIAGRICDDTVKIGVWF